MFLNFKLVPPQLAIPQSIPIAVCAIPTVFLAAFTLSSGIPKTTVKIENIFNNPLFLFIFTVYLFANFSIIDEYEYLKKKLKNENML